jgi:hypothetical protein
VNTSVLSAGGGAKASTTYRMLGTTGQPLPPGRMSSGNYSITSGYWAVVP